jgi:hypothetical protein
MTAIIKALLVKKWNTGGAFYLLRVLFSDINRVS